MKQDDVWMQEAIILAQEAADLGEVPIGAVLVYQDQIIAKAKNQPISTQDPCAHAEIIALRAGAQAMGNYRLLGSTLYVTLEPCLMCAAAMVHARIKRLVFAAYNPKGGAIETCHQTFSLPFLNHRIEYQGGVLAETAAQMLSQFFQNKRG